MSNLLLSTFALIRETILPLINCEVKFNFCLLHLFFGLFVSRVTFQYGPMAY